MTDYLYIDFFISIFHINSVPHWKLYCSFVISFWCFKSVFAVYGPQQPDVHQKPPGQTYIQPAEHPEIHRLQWDLLDASHCLHALQVSSHDRQMFVCCSFLMSKDIAVTSYLSHWNVTTLSTNMSAWISDTVVEVLIVFWDSFLFMQPSVYKILRSHKYKLWATKQTGFPCCQTQF